nr:hypothetical protein CFP56_77823 [Quercus suber]
MIQKAHGRSRSGLHVSVTQVYQHSPFLSKYSILEPCRSYPSHGWGRSPPPTEKLGHNHLPANARKRFSVRRVGDHVDLRMLCSNDLPCGQLPLKDREGGSLGASPITTDHVCATSEHRTTRCSYFQGEVKTSVDLRIEDRRFRMTGEI